MTDLDLWAVQWGVSPQALHDLRVRLLGADGSPATALPGESEAAVQARVRVAASRAGMRVWRNNVGVFSDPTRGIHVRFGLANDTPAVNAQLKSGDLIGVAPRVVAPADVGRTIGQFVSFECKHGGWRYVGNEREKAQEAWAVLVRSLGGIARFVTGPEGVRE